MSTAPLPLELPPAAPVFRQSLPVLLTTFVNKVGAVGLSLLPMLLVERALPSETSSLVMGLVKAAVLLGSFAGGWVADRAGLRVALVSSFAIAGTGLALLPLASDWVVLAALAMLAQLGNAMFHSPARLLVTSAVAPEHQREAIGWLRGAVNGGQIVSFS
ncbi:MAG: MFS transporter, partial [Myxococcales bacterium]